MAFSRRQFFRTLAAAPVVPAFLRGAHALDAAERTRDEPSAGAQAGSAGRATGAVAQSTLVYVGTYTASGKSKGIYLFRLQTDSRDVAQNSTLVPMGVAAETPSPSFLELDPRRRVVFAVNELNEFQGKPTGGVSAFSIDRSTGALTLINQQSSMGTGPCHLVLSNDRKWLFVANYGSGSVAMYPVAASGQLGAASDVAQHTGSSINTERQRGPHAHCVTLDPAGRLLWVCDLGLDKVLAYRIDGGRLTPHNPPFAQIKPGAGPRHMIFRPDGRFAYVANELNSTVTVFRYDARSGVMHEVQTVSTLPERFEGTNFPAEIDVHPSGKWVYVSNRGHDSVVLFNVDAARGTLTYVAEHSTGGVKPRHFGIEPSAKHMAICNQDSDTVIVASIDAGNGRLKPSGVVANAPSPVCAKFLPPAR